MIAARSEGEKLETPAELPLPVPVYERELLLVPQLSSLSS